MIDYKGISEAELILALYMGTRAQGMGHLHDTPGLTLEDVEKDFSAELNEKRIRIDYYRGRPLKVSLDTVGKQFDERLYDRDAGQGAAEDAVSRLRDRSKVA